MRPPCHAAALRGASAALLVFLLAAPALSQPVAAEHYIVTCRGGTCGDVAATVAGLGGAVTQRFQNIDAIAVSVPRGRSSELIQAVGGAAVRKDQIVGKPVPFDVTAAEAPVGVLDASQGAGSAEPLNYVYNNDLTGASALHATGIAGGGVIVAVIDSGIAAASTVPALAGRVIGGESFVPPAIDPLPATHRENAWHGTAVAEMVAANVSWLFNNTSRTVAALQAYAPGSVFPCDGTNCPATSSIVPMRGTAPQARLYALKTFPADGGGAPESRIIAAMDRAITMRRNFNNGMPSVSVSGSGTEFEPYVYDSLKIDVVNMSLGGPTLFAGRDLEDQLTLKMLEVGITLVTSAGNDGPAAMTGGSPGTGLGSLTVGAASTPVHEGVLRYNQYGPAVGALFRPTSHIQVADFSARGPTADGRPDPDVSANGVASFVHVMAALTSGGGLVDCRGAGAVAGTCVGRILFVGGTSFSSPTVAGAAALVRQAVPAATAVEVRNALQESANPALLGDGSAPIDRGAGLLDIPAAIERLQTGAVSTTVPHLRWATAEDPVDALGRGGRSVLLNVWRAGHPPVVFDRHNRFTTTVRDLLPGQVAHFFVPSDPTTERFTVEVTNVAPELPPNQQNQLFGDDVIVNIVDAPTSFSDLREFQFVSGDTTFTVDNPQTGLVRIAVMGDWTNAGRVSATLKITRTRKFELPSALGFVAQDAQLPFGFDVPAGTSALEFKLAWMQNWGRYPTNDIDLLIFDPSGNLDQSGATIASPERVVIENPAPGRWTAVVVGFTLHDLRGLPDQESNKLLYDVFSLRASADGRLLKARR